MLFILIYAYVWRTFVAHFLMALIAYTLTINKRKSHLCTGSLAFGQKLYLIACCLCTISEYCGETACMRGAVCLSAR